MKEIWIGILTFFRLAWWVEIVTDSPACTYYFGAFASAKAAKAAQPGYIEDLEQEGAKGIKVAVKRCSPDRLTIFDESELKSDRPSTPIFSHPVRHST